MGVEFQSMPMAEIMASLQLVHNESGPEPSAKREVNLEPHPTVRPHPNTQVANFNFEEVEHLPFKLNLGDVPLDKEQHTKFIDLIYSNQEVFSLHDKDLSYTHCLTHTILISTSKPVYVLHRTILRQLQGEVHECLNTWLHQRIIHPPNIIVTMHQKLLLYIKYLGRFASVWITGNCISLPSRMYFLCLALMRHYRCTQQ